MGLIPDPHHHRLHLVHVGLPGNVTAVATQLDGAMRGCTWLVCSDTPLEEFLARENYEIPDGTPVIRLDLTGDETYFARVSGGPHWQHDVPAGHIRPPLGHSRPYAGEPWTALTGWYVALDVYVDLAPSAGVVIEHTGHRASAPSRP
jgi:hypothetical protein